VSMVRVAEDSSLQINLFNRCPQNGRTRLAQESLSFARAENRCYNLTGRSLTRFIARDSRSQWKRTERSRRRLALTGYVSVQRLAPRLRFNQVTNSSLSFRRSKLCPTGSNASRFVTSSCSQWMDRCGKRIPEPLLSIV